MILEKFSVHFYHCFIIILILDNSSFFYLITKQSVLVAIFNRPAASGSQLVVFLVTFSLKDVFN